MLRIMSVVLPFTYLVGCAPTWQELPITEKEVDKGGLSYGMVTSKVDKGKTTQEEIIRLFGPPGISTINSDGEEVWIYDKSYSESNTQSYQEANNIGTFFGFGLGQKESNKSGIQRVSRTKTLTVIVTFDKRKIVKEYSARATQF